ncbi:hypothetical protein LTR62_005835 [Meristemomyces frigidus]|uniref:CFEM domain-containing protein n=1 Tax=Meristemomyces frigidus TaxID=1508187 RepID=A0AAN7TKF9_9PEZI|nr:hypothetical protein LTR62_005835 [Meristemomyces frigidus]
MKSFAAATVLAAIATTAVAQLSNLPTCALSPAIAAIGSSGCATTDIKCICSNTAFISALEPAIAAACSPADQAKALAAAQGLCTQAGVSLALPASGSAPATSMTSAAMTSSMAASATAASTTTATTDVTLVYPSASMMPNATMTQSMKASGSMMASMSSMPAAYTGAAATQGVLSGVVGIVAAGAGLAMAFA